MSIEPIRPGDSEQRHRLRRQAFNNQLEFDPDEPGVEPERVVGAYVGDRLVGCAVTLPMESVWGGRAIRCGGVAGVVVAPEARGGGVARRVLAESFDRMAARGETVSMLYPTTATLYRSMGYEIGGTWTRRRIPLGEVPAAPADELAWRPVDSSDPALKEVHDAMALSFDGWTRPGRAWWDHRAHAAASATGENHYCYVGSRAGDDVAAVEYRYANPSSKLYHLDADLIVGIDGDAVAAALGFLARHGTAADAVVTSLPPVVLAPHVPQLQRAEVRQDWPWMLRLVDAPGAFTARAWPTSVRGSVALDIADDVRPDNAGPHVLTIADGSATLLRGGDGRVAVTATTLAALYCGTPASTLAHAGRLPGASADDIAFLTAAMATTPSTPFFF